MDIHVSILPSFWIAGCMGEGKSGSRGVWIDAHPYSQPSVFIPILTAILPTTQLYGLLVVQLDCFTLGWTSAWPRIVRVRGETLLLKMEAGRGGLLHFQMLDRI
ncbi:MAG: hypothetical protein JSR76_02880 [Verrucomicrobia bacterium]|nr:hypothetical protein [Verrucomicrobiota bacterium]